MLLGWSGGAIVLGKLLVPGHPTDLDNKGARPTVLAVAGGVVWKFFSHLNLSPFSLSLGDSLI